jgi:hypothetical protein
MLQLNRINAWIEAEGIRLKEYKVETSPNGQMITCYIPSSEGKVRVRWFSKDTSVTSVRFS